ncbi:MAG: precorrin-3B C(17)-methyltransferase [Planctomycetes bacterium]|nr:precorrin-3B C(17)-methyltransferase [Planctomycetota bacterium]
MSTLWVVGIGPGGRDGMTGQALAALEAAEVHCGYQAYVDLVRPLFPDKEVVATGMTREVERCQEALRLAASGRAVAMICSGDAGVYGMAGLVLELAGDIPPVDIEIVPGVSAAMAGAVVLGAPLMHDFAVISLSDLMTEWSLIEARLAAAAQADFVLCLYNPSSRKRHDYLARAAAIVGRHRAPDTVCGWVRNIGRDGQTSGILDLVGLESFAADMFTTVFIGNSQTKRLGDRMVTPRGYRGLS